MRRFSLPDEDPNGEEGAADDGAAEAAAARASCAFLKRSIIAIPGASRCGGFAATVAVGLDGASAGATWAIRCFLTGMTTESESGGASSVFRFF